MRAVLLATCAALPQGDPDDRLLVEALRHSGITPTWAVWDDPAVDWSAAPVLLRSTWDYTMRREQFLTWAESVPVLFNRADVVRWSSDKRYLLDLQAAGVPVTPTSVYDPERREWAVTDQEWVVKPSVGAGSRGAGRFPNLPAALTHAGELHAAGRTALMQEYLGGVETRGETALLFFGGRFSHAARKGPMLGDGAPHALDESRGLYVEENITARTPATDELVVAARAVQYVRDRFGTMPVYARVDVLASGYGPVVVELELIEPSLFLGVFDGAASDAAQAVLAAGR